MPKGKQAQEKETMKAELKLHGVGDSKIVIDGKEFGGITRLTLTAGHKEVTTLTLECLLTDGAEVDALIEELKVEKSDD